MTIPRRTSPLLIALLACLAGCYEQPVVERLTVAFLPEGGVRVTVSHRISPPAGRNPALDARIEETRRALLEGTDDLSRAFASLHPLLEQGSWEKREGGLVRHERSAVLDAPESLRDFFARTALRPAFRTVGGKAEFSISPAWITRATHAQRDRVEREMVPWSDSVSEYLVRARRLFAYLGEHPDRAQACFGHILSENLSEEARNALPKPNPEEEPLIKDVEEAMVAVLEILKVSEGEAYTLDELSNLVFNPFPADFTVEAPSPLIKVEGFERTGERTARVPGLGIWQAYRSMRNRWLEPDPLQAYLEASADREEGRSFDLKAFCSRPRRAAEPPDAAGVHAALEQALTPQDLYLVSWRIPAGNDGASRAEPVVP